MATKAPEIRFLALLIFKTPYLRFWLSLFDLALD
jgi:hypothetical protein